MSFNCKSCGGRMNLMRVSPDGINWRDAFVCTGPKIGCGIKELDDILPSWQEVSEAIERADSEHCAALELEQNSTSKIGKVVEKEVSNVQV